MSCEKFKQETEAFLKTVSVDRVGKVVDEVFRNSFEELLRQCDADAGALWVVDHEAPSTLTIAINVGDKGEAIEGNVSQQLDCGLVSRAFNDSTFVHDVGLFRSKDQSLDVDMQLGQMTTQQMANPFKMFGQSIGALTVVQLSAINGTARRDFGFKEDAVRAFQNWLPVAQRLVEYSVVCGE
jgi:hypothetical protein